MWQLVKDLVSGFSALFRFKDRQQELQNRPEMQANARAQVRETIREETTKAVREQDDEAIKRGLAE